VEGLEKQPETFSAGLLLGAFEEFSKVDRWVTTKASDERPRGSVGLVEDYCVLEGPDVTRAGRSDHGDF
jgi:hypothetical protein